MVDKVLAELAAAGGPVVLIIDDLHELSSADANEQLTALLTSLPPGIHAVLATRRDPPLRLHQLRLGGQLAEIRAAQLRFTAGETRRLLTAAGITLPQPGGGHGPPCPRCNGHASTAAGGTRRSRPPVKRATRPPRTRMETVAASADLATATVLAMRGDLDRVQPLLTGALTSATAPSTARSPPGPGMPRDSPRGQAAAT